MICWLGDEGPASFFSGNRPRPALAVARTPSGRRFATYMGRDIPRSVMYRRRPPSSRDLQLTRSHRRGCDLPDRIEREIEEILRKIDEFVPERPRRTPRKRTAQAPGATGQSWVGSR